MADHQKAKDARLPPPNSFGQRQSDIYKRLKQSAEQCRLNYSGRKELATEEDDAVSELCEALEDTFSYGLRQQQAGIGARVLFQNMQEIMTGRSMHSNSVNGSGPISNEATFWDFCQTHLTAHERERYDNLKQVWTKCGRGRAFIRATLNENSLQRYLLTWLDAEEQLHAFYSPWSLLVHAETRQELPRILGELDKVLFALSVDAVELNTPTRATLTAPSKEEPIIYAPTPAPVVNNKQKRKGNAVVVERPITTVNSTEDLLNTLQQAGAGADLPKLDRVAEVTVDVEFPEPENYEHIFNIPTDPIEPELEFLKQPLTDLYPIANGIEVHDEECEDKSDSSSQYSKSSSSANCGALEERLRDITERYAQLETRVAQLSRENHLLRRRLVQQFKETGIDPSASLTDNFLITIPQVLLRKSTHGAAYHAYEIHITMRRCLEHWLVLRRYRDFWKLHQSLVRTHPSVASVELPPKKHFGNKRAVFVEERRQQLQIYLLNVIESLPKVEACKTKAELQKVFPFLRER